MGVGLVPILESRITGVDPYNIEGKALAAAWPAIDELASQLGVIPCSEFGDNSEEENDERPASDMPWHNPADGLRTVTALREHLRANPDAVPDSEYVCYDLEDITEVLSAADKSEVRFRFEMLG